MVQYIIKICNFKIKDIGLMHWIGVLGSIMSVWQES